MVKYSVNLTPLWPEHYPRENERYAEWRQRVLSRKICIVCGKNCKNLTSYRTYGTCRANACEEEYIKFRALYDSYMAPRVFQDNQYNKLIGEKRGENTRETTPNEAQAGVTTASGYSRITGAATTTNTAIDPNSIRF